MVPWECGISAGWCLLVNCTCHATAVIQLDHNSTNQPPECPDVVTNVDRTTVRPNRSQTEPLTAVRGGGARPQAVGAVCVLCSVRVCSV